jgi:hypothetical protein
VRAAFAAMAAAAPGSRSLRDAILREVGSNPGTLTAHLDGRGPTLVPAMAALVAEGQRRGELRDDEPPAALAAILVYGVLGALRLQHTGPPSRCRPRCTCSPNASSSTGCAPAPDSVGLVHPSPRRRRFGS